MVVLGGIGTLWGGLLGAGCVVLLEDRLASSRLRRRRPGHRHDLRPRRAALPARHLGHGARPDRPRRGRPAPEALSRTGAAAPSMRRVTDSRADEVALNRALWAVVNERFTDAAADELWARPDAVWGLFAVPERELGVLGDVRGLDVLELACGTAYFSAWLARAGASARWRSTSPASSWRPPAGCSAGSARFPAGAGRRASSCRWPTAASTSWSASTAPRRGATPSAGCPRPPGCCAPVDAWCSSPTATCRRCASRPTRASRRSGCCAGSARPTACSGPGAGSSSTRRTATGCGCCAVRGSSSRRCTSCSRRPTATDHPFYEIVSPHWASRWPAEELWVARRA